MSNNNYLVVMCENEVPNYDYFKSFKKIGVERGCLDLIKNNQLIDLAISDFDNVIDEELDLIKKNSEKFEILDTKKDLIDGEIAIRRAFADGASCVVAITKPTKRYDMNLSVISLVANYNVKIMNSASVIFKVEKGETTLPFAQYQGFTYITFFPTKNTKLTLSSFRYNVEDFELEPFELRAYSNSFYAMKDGHIKTSEDIICILSK